MEQHTARPSQASPAPSDESTAPGWPVPTGTTALSLPVPEAEPLVADWRARYDTAAAHGGAAHLTVLFPFLHRAEVDAGACAALGELFARHRPFEVRFERCGRFPGVLYLVPEPGRPVRALTRAVHDRWPEHPPYGGIFDKPEAAEAERAGPIGVDTGPAGGQDPNPEELDGDDARGLDPHLTVANTGGERLHDRIAAALAPRLPIVARMTAVSLVEFDGLRWRDLRSFPLGGPRAA